jgi:arylsulfatase A-like enzyme
MDARWAAMTNVILIMTDQQRADSLGCTGNSVVKTPNVDALAERGAVFRDHHTPHQICSPSRATLFTGLLARHHGLTRNGVALPETLPLITHDLKRAGYQTHGVGKFHFQPILASAEHQMPDSNAFWTLPESKDWTGPFYGFDTVDILIGESVGATEGGHYANWLNSVAPEAACLFLPENALEKPPVDCEEIWKSAVPEELHYNSWIADRACDFISSADADDPFFLFVSFPDPHHPFTPPAPWCDMYDPADMPAPNVRANELDLMPGYISESDGASGGKSYVEFLRNPGPPREQGFMQTTFEMSDSSLKLAMAHTYGMVSMIDAKVGQIMAALEARGLTEDTLVIFTTDHGELLGDHSLIRKGPTPYRQLLNIPLVIAGPGVAHGSRSQLTSHLGLKATLLEYLGVNGARGDGQSFASVLNEADAVTSDRLFAEYHPRTRQETYNQSLITKDWRLTRYPNQPDWGELFDLGEDPGEHCNLYHNPEFSPVRENLTEQLQRDFAPAPDAGGQSIATY